MDFLPDQETMTYWITHYGAFSLFILLALGVVALPVPDETLMVLAGILIKAGELPFVSTVLASFLGSMFGITLSYVLGRTAGSGLLHRYGGKIGLSDDKLAIAHEWFAHYGKWTLTFGYFLPGIRHLTGFAAGSSELAYPQFALFAYLGAAIWATVFLSIGYFVGNYWYDLIAIVEKYSDFAFPAAFVIAVLAYFLYRRYRTVNL